MRRLLRLLLIASVAALLGFAALVLTARSGWLKPDEAEMRARYGLPTSHYLKLGAQQLHYVDEGSGPVVVLVHGSYASLRQWQEWADALKGNYRVIRFDRPGMGLSGPSPDGRQDGEAEARLIGQLAAKLDLDRFVIAGTSSSGEGVAHYAARNPQRVSGVILANIAAGPITPQPPHFPLWFQAVLKADPLFKGWHPRLFWRGILEMNFSDKAKVTPRLVREWTDLNNRAQGWPRKPWPGGKPPFSGTPDDLKAIKAPALVLWSANDPDTPLETHGRQTMALLASADKNIAVFKNCGHMLPQECGTASAAAVQLFLARTAKTGTAK